VFFVVLSYVFFDALRYWLAGWLEGRTSGPQKPAPLIPEGSLPEQEREENRGSSSFIWKKGRKREVVDSALCQSRCVSIG